MRLVAWVARQALPGMSDEDQEELQSMLDAVEREEERRIECEASRMAGAYVLADVCRKLVRMPVISFTGGAGG